MPRNDQSVFVQRIVVWKAILLSTLIAQAGAESATHFPGEYFTHKDWEVACDNTGTCRMAGYQSDEFLRVDAVSPVSVLLVRKAGADEAVSGWVKLGESDESDTARIEQISAENLFLFIDEQSLGAMMERDDDNWSYRLSAAQIAGLRHALRGTGQVEFRHQDYRWRLSGQGASAVMLKADEYQGRVSTTGALVNPGKQSEEHVFAAQSAPVVHKVIPAEPIDYDQAADAALFAELKAQMGKLVAPTLTGSGESDWACPTLQNSEYHSGKDDPWEIIRLDGDHLVASHTCWSAAYNWGYGVWVLNDQPPYQPRLMTTSASDPAENSEIYERQKGRGVGDCWYQADWVWDGGTFVRTYEGTTGLCREIAAGGAWELPTWVSEVLTTTIYE